MLERLKQTSTGGYLIDELPDANATKDHSQDLVKRIDYLKRFLGFKDKICTLRSFQSTLVSRFKDPGVLDFKWLGYLAMRKGNDLWSVCW